MKISECEGGDIVVVELDGELCWLQVGYVAGVRGTGKKRTPPTMVFTTNIDRETLLPEKGRTLSAQSPDLEVVDVVERAAYRRLTLKRRAVDAAGEDLGDADPLRSKATTTEGW